MYVMLGEIPGVGSTVSICWLLSLLLLSKEAQAVAPETGSEFGLITASFNPWQVT